ncbi:pPIWI_RE_Y domain-containing protein [Streptomyces violaceorubidus]
MSAEQERGEAERMLRLVATGLVRLSQLRGPGDPVYPDATQAAYNHLVLGCLRLGKPAPGSVPELARWACEKPLAEWWPFGLPDEETGGLRLVDPDTAVPVQECLEWAISAPDPAAEQIENELLGEALTLSRAAKDPDAYTAFRRLLIERPVLTGAEIALLGSNLDLALLHATVKRCYEPVTEAHVGNGHCTTCARCGCLLVPLRDGGYACQLDRCRRETVRAGRRIAPSASGGLYHLTRPLRTFITGPGLAETGLEAELAGLGIQVRMWPNYDAYDLHITLPGGSVWAVDVKDRANPALLARGTTPLRGDPPYDRGLLIVPAYRFQERDGYREVFLHHLPEETGGRIELLTDKELLCQARAALGTTKKGGWNA